mmetsp:Transcript_20719/g.52612  ORF Transcript_20719/g.52612 Transcript_20719/m.52612 type:complete len:451 (+) Transcript_20719:965-2317(+)
MGVRPRWKDSFSRPLAPMLSRLAMGLLDSISSAVNSSHSSERLKCGPCSCLRASSSASAYAPRCSSRRSRHGSTGCDSGTGWKQGRDCATLPGTVLAARPVRAALRTTRCVTPTMAASAREMPTGYTSWSNSSSMSCCCCCLSSGLVGRPSSGCVSEDGNHSCMPCGPYDHQGISTPAMPSVGAGCGCASASSPPGDICSPAPACPLAMEEVLAAWASAGAGVRGSVTRWPSGSCLVVAATWPGMLMMELEAPAMGSCSCSWPDLEPVLPPRPSPSSPLATDGALDSEGAADMGPTGMLSDSQNVSTSVDRVTSEPTSRSSALISPPQRSSTHCRGSSCVAGLAPFAPCASSSTASMCSVGEVGTSARSSSGRPTSSMEISRTSCSDAAGFPSGVSCPRTLTSYTAISSGSLAMSTCRPTQSTASGGCVSGKRHSSDAKSRWYLGKSSSS